PHKRSDRVRVGINCGFSHDRSRPAHHTDRCLLQRHVQSHVAFHCCSPSLRGHMETASCVPGELIPCAFVWHDPGITPCCKSLFCTDDQKFSRIPEEPHFKGTPVET